MEFWNTVKLQIRQQNTTQEWVAKKSGIDFGTFRGWITHGRLPRVGEAVAIAKALETTVEYLAEGEAGVEYVRSVVTREGRLYKPPQRIAIIVDALGRLDSGKLETVRTMVVALAGEAEREKAQGS